MKFTDVYLQTLTKILVFIIMTFSIYVLFAGHHNPGGGFIGGLITASALILLYFTFGLETIKDVIPFDYKKMAASGVLLALVTGMVSLFLDIPFLTQGFRYIELPFLGKTEIASALPFDLGVYLTVVGSTMTIITTISEDEK